MRVAEGVPEDDVGVRDSAIGVGPAAKPVAALTLVGIVSSGVTFFFAIGRDPYVIIDEAGALAPPSVFRREGKAIVTGQKLVADRFADGVEDIRVDDLPGACGFEAEVGPCVLFLFEQTGVRGEGVLERVLRTQRIGDDVDLVGRVG